MFGTIHDPSTPVPAEAKPASQLSPLGEQAQSFFAGYGGKVTAASSPRPSRPGAPAQHRPAPPRSRPISSRPGSFAAAAGDAAHARAKAEAVEAEIIDDTFFDCDSPGC
jgi:hypothetical protein